MNTTQQQSYKYLSTRYLFYNDPDSLLSNPADILQRLDWVYNKALKGLLIKITLDFETNGLNPHTLRPLLAAVKINIEDAGSFTLVFDLLDDSIKKIFNQFFTTILTKCTKHTLIKLFGHNLKYDLQVLYNLDNKFIELTAPHRKNLMFVDTMIYSQVINRGKNQSNSLGAVANRLLGIELDKGEQKLFTKVKHDDYLFTESQITYAASDVEYIEDIYKKTVFESSKKIHTYIRKVEFKLVPILARLEYKGINFDKDKWLENLKESEFELLSVEEKLDFELSELGEIVPPRAYEVGNHLNLFSTEPSTLIIKNNDAFNYNSPKQLKELYLKYAGEYDIPKDKDGEFSTGRESLERYIRDNKDSKLHTFTKLLLEQRKWKKRISSFGENFIDMAKITGRIHTSYRQNGTSTGRFSSGDSRNGFPNMSQIPRDNKFRTCFTADEGYKIMTVDLGQAELRILASESKDAKMIDLINNHDLHSYLATKAMTRLKGEEFIVSKTENADIRTKFKNVNFGLIYGATAFRISELLDISIDDAEIVYGVIKEEIPNAIKFLEQAGDQAVDTGKVTISRQHDTYRHFDLDSKYESSIRREAMNAPIQGLNAHMIKYSMVVVDKYLFNEGGRFGNILLQVYDELVIQIKDDNFLQKRVEDIDQILKNCCNLYLDDSIKMETEYQIGTTWVK